MKHVHFFQWNIPADNHYLGRADWYINVIAEWDNNYYNNDTPLVSVSPVNIDFVDLRQVKNWEVACRQIVEIAQKHFADIARLERINKARAELIAEGELIDNPILARYAESVNPLISEIITNHFTPVS